MSDVINLGTKINSLNVSPQFDPYSKVIIHIDNETQVSAGNNSGRVLEMQNPLGTKALAEEILARLRGFRYQPFYADDAMLDPAAEIGDAVNTPSSYGGIYTRSRTFGDLMAADISAPHDEEINHEYAYESPQERKFKREMGDVRASLLIQNNMIQSEVAARQNADNAMSTRITETASAVTIEAARATQAEGALSAALSVQASEIAAKVNAAGGGGSFSWVMRSASHTWKANNADVMRVSASGLWLKGIIEASGGTIGGFNIGQKALQYNGLNWGDTDKNYGVYLGQSGLQLGKGFKSDNAGNVTASSLKLRGTITFLNDDGTTAGTMSAANLRTGASQAYNNYSAWNGTTTTVGNNSGYWTGGASNGYDWGNTKDRNRSSNPNVYLGSCSCVSLLASQFYLGNFRGDWMQLTINGTPRWVLVGNYYG